MNYNNESLRFAVIILELVNSWSDTAQRPSGPRAKLGLSITENTGPTSSVRGKSHWCFETVQYEIQVHEQRL